MQTFLMEPGQWVGSGKILLPLGEQTLPFSVSWKGNGHCWIHCVTLEGATEPVVNAYRICKVDEAWKIQLESPHLGSLEGELIYGEDHIGWEFTGEGFSGFELFRRISSNTYQHVAEFSNGDGMQTKIAGEIQWVTVEPS